MYVCVIITTILQSDNSRITLSENKDYVLIGDLETLLRPLRESKLEGQEASGVPDPPGKARLSDKTAATTPREDTPMSIIRISNLDTVCQVTSKLYTNSVR